MIYITGDTHGDFKRFSNQNFPQQNTLTKKDYVIICGDFGGIWHKNSESPDEKIRLDELNCKKYTTLFVDGNHENYDRLYNDYSTIKWNGGYVHEIRKNVFHLIRGEVYNIDEKKFFSFGGASSHDIDGGILELNDTNYKEKKKELDESLLSYRVNHVSWWKEELPSKTEMDNAKKNLSKNNWCVDYVLTHCAPTSIQSLLSHGLYKKDIETDFLEEIKNNLTFKKWYFGHYHDNKTFDNDFVLLHNQIIPIGEPAIDFWLGHPRYIIGDSVIFKVIENNKLIQKVGRISIVNKDGDKHCTTEPTYTIWSFNEKGKKDYYHGVQESLIKLV